MDINEIYEKVDAFLIDELEIDEAKIEENARLKEDLGIDSLEVVDVIVLVEQEFGFKMRPELPSACCTDVWRWSFRSTCSSGRVFAPLTPSTGSGWATMP